MKKLFAFLAIAALMISVPASATYTTEVVNDSETVLVAGDDAPVFAQNEPLLTPVNPSK